MKKVISIILSLVLCLSLCACGRSLEEQARTAIYTKVTNLVLNGFDDVGFRGADIVRLTETDENEWETSGKTRFADKYGNMYVGTFEGTVTYSETYGFRCDIDIEDTFRREN